MNATVRGNLIGIGALLMWCTMTALIRSVTDAFGVAAGPPLIYSVGAIVILLKNGVPKIRIMPKSYLLGAGGFFVAYEIVYSRALAIAETSRQTLEVGMLNYLWPCLTLLFAIWINKAKLKWWVWPGTAISITGMYWCLTSNSGGDLAGFIASVAAGPMPYIFGLAAGIVWAVYSNISFRYSEGHNAVPLFFAVIALILWAGFFMNGGELHFPGLWPCVQLLFLGAVMGISYSMWESGIHQGNFIFLAICSYFTPAFAMLFAALWLNSMPPAAYWAGVTLVVGGSLICWAASVKKA